MAGAAVCFGSPIVEVTFGSTLTEALEFGLVAAGAGLTFDILDSLSGDASYSAIFDEWAMLTADADVNHAAIFKRG